MCVGVSDCLKWLFLGPGHRMWTDSGLSPSEDLSVPSLRARTCHTRAELGPDIQVNQEQLAQADADPQTPCIIYRNTHKQQSVSEHAGKKVLESFTLSLNPFRICRGGKLCRSGLGSLKGLRTWCVFVFSCTWVAPVALYQVYWVCVCVCMCVCVYLLTHSWSPADCLPPAERPCRSLLS